MDTSKKRSGALQPAMLPGTRRVVPRDRPMTAEEFFCLPDDGMQHELLDGVLIEMTPPGGGHASTASRVAYALSAHVLPNGLGEVLVGDPGIYLGRNPDRVRAPDVCFVAREHVPQNGLPEGFLDFVPDLIVEVVSPGDSRREVEQKVQDWLDAGARLVWIVYPRTRSVAALTAESSRVYAENDLLDAGGVLPGFSVRVSEFFR